MLKSNYDLQYEVVMSESKFRNMAKVVGLYVPLLLIILTASPLADCKKAKTEDYRLGDIHQPTHYNITLEVDPNRSEYSGKVTIYFTASEASDQVELHASPKTLKIIDVVHDFVKSCSVTEPEDDTEIVTLTCVPKIPTGERILTIMFNGTYPEYPDNEYLGVYRTVYEGDSYVSTQFEPTYARRAFPCFDEPRFKSTFQLRIVHPAEYTSVLSNTEVQNSSAIEGDNGMTLTVFEETPPMSTYTLAFLVSKFKKSVAPSTRDSTFEFNVYTRPEMAKYTTTALTYGSEIVTCLGEWTGKKYEEMGDEQIDQVAVVDFQFGAMENWGLIVYKESYLLDEAGNTSEQQRQTIIGSLTHELAHQWFGNLLTLDWWADAWLNEGFATYCQYFIPDQLKDIGMTFESQFATDVTQVALEIDGFESSPPLSSPDVETASEDMAKFDDISYKKGASVLRMLRSVLGDDKFHQAVKTYVNENQYNITNPSIVLQTFDKYFDNDDYNLTDIMHSWIYQSGYPVLTVTMNGDSVIVSQERFVYPTITDKSNTITNDSEEVDVDSTQWFVPISYTTSSELEFKDSIREWLEPNSSLRISAKNVSWVILNNQRTGFYRVNYDETLRKNIIKFLKGKNMTDIHVSNRAQLVDDIFALARSGHVGYQAVFDLADYLQYETEYQPWSAAFKGLKFLFNKLNDDDELIQKLKEKTLLWLNRAFPNVSNDNATHVQVLRNTLVLDWKCQLEDSDCLNHVNDIFEKYKKQQYIDDFNNRRTILCHGLRNSSSAVEDYKLLLSNYEKSELVVEKNEILSAIGCSEDPDVLNLYLSEMISNDTIIRKQDITDAYKAAYTTKTGVNATLAFLEEHLGELIKKYEDIIEPATYFSGLADKITSVEELQTLSDLMDSYGGPEDLQSIRAEITDTVNVTMEWINNHSEEIKTILSSKTSSAVKLCSVSSIFLGLMLILVNVY